MESMRKVISPLLILALIVLPVSELISFDSSEPEQAEDKTVVIHEKVGESIDIKERDYYKLFIIYKDFQSAAVFQTADSSYVIQIVEIKNGKRYINRIPLEQSILVKLRDYFMQFDDLLPTSITSYFTPHEKLILGIEYVKKEKDDLVSDKDKVYNLNEELRKAEVLRLSINKRAKALTKEKWAKDLAKEKWSRERWRDERKNDRGITYRTSGSLLGFTLGAAAGMLIGNMRQLQGEQVHTRTVHHEGGWDGPYNSTEYYYSYKHKYAPYWCAGIGGITGAVAGYYIGKRADKKYYVVVPQSIRKDKVVGTFPGSLFFGCCIIGPAVGYVSGKTLEMRRTTDYNAKFGMVEGIAGYVLGSVVGTMIASGFNNRKKHIHLRMWKESLIEEHPQSYLKLELLPTDPTAFSMRRQKLPCGSVFSEYRMNMMRLSF